MCQNCNNIYQHKNCFEQYSHKDTRLIFGDYSINSEIIFSIIITVYKRKEYIHEAINSVINQKGINILYEIIIICDDPDFDLSEFDIYKCNKHIFLYCNIKNVGLYNSVNIASQMSRGRYISLLHDDDILYPDYLLNVFSFLKKKGNVKCLIVNRNIIFKNKNISINIFFKLFIYIIFFPVFLIRILFKNYFKIITLKEGLTYLLSNVYKAPSCGTLFEKDTFIKSGGFNQDYWPVSDFYYFLRFNKDNPVFFLKKKLSCYRWLDNLSQNKSIQLSSFEHLAVFFNSIQPLNSINKYYSFFKNEVLYSKFLMIDKEYRNEIIKNYTQLNKINYLKWILFKIFNKFFMFIHDISV